MPPLSITRHPAQWILSFHHCAGCLVVWMLIGLFAPREAQGQSVHYDADSLMNLVFHFVENENINNDGFQAEIYLQHYLRTRRKGPIARYIPELLRLEKGINEYFGEHLSRYQFLPPGRIDKKDIASYNTMPYVRAPRDRWLGRYSTSIYAPNFFTDRVLSPMNAINRKLYRYRFNYTYVSEGRIIANISVDPKFENTQLVRGSIDVDTQNGEVQNFNFRFKYGWAQLHLSGEMGTEGQARLFPRKVSLHSKVKIFGNSLEEQFNGDIRFRFLAPQKTDSTLKYTDRFDLTEMSRLRVDTTQMIRDKSFFDAHRPIPLLPEQAAIYKTDSLLQLQKKKTVIAKDTLDRLPDETQDLLFDSHTFNLGGSGEVVLPPILTPSMLEWSGSKGLSLQTRLQFQMAMGKYNSIKFRPRVGYNFKQKQVYWQLPLEINVLPHLDGQLSIEAVGGEHIYNSKQADDVRERMKHYSNYDSLVQQFNQYHFHYYRDHRVLLQFSLQPLMGLKLQPGVRFNHRSLMNWNSIAQASGMRRTLSNLAPRVNIVWTPAQYYYREGKRRHALHSQWPTLMLDYERSLPGIDRHTAYERIEMDAKYRWPLHALRSLYLRVGGGFYTRRGADCFLDYDHFRNNYLPEGVDDKMSGQFQLLDSRWYNESNYYARLSVAYESPMLWLSRIRFLSRMVHQERLYVNLLSVRSLPIYTEWGYGISLHLMDLAGFISVAGKSQTSIGGKVVFRLGKQ